MMIAISALFHYLFRGGFVFERWGERELYLLGGVSHVLYVMDEMDGD